MENGNDRMESMESVQPFTVSRGTIFKTLVFKLSTGWPLWALFLIGVLIILIGSYDLRWVVVGLIICLTVVPTLAFYLFIKHMFATEMVANLLNHTVECRSNSYIVHIFRPADQASPAEKGKDWVESGRLTLFEYNIVSKKITSDYQVLFFKNSPLEILYIPI
ncbi:MAG: hypothetical protein K2G85_08210 [Muribaculaceae bacterium]|nr:hypothetical protein [Muribaculaceae bacterium]